MIRCRNHLFYFVLLCLITAVFSVGGRGQEVDAAAPTDDAVVGDAEGTLATAVFRVNVFETAESARPEWERALSQGTVNVIIPDDFNGEQKRLPEYLDMVPGLHVERRGGEGQYSTVTMRGSTSAQVAIYVDGVPQNHGGDFAIDLSLIPMDDVARIEVYRGYVPARFSGAPIGGVINIVTKKPMGFSFNVSAGAKSFSSRNADATFTAPLLGGSLLLGFNHDRSDGDFGYTYRAYNESWNPNCGTLTPCDRTRKSNSHKNSDALIKWQDANWYFKWAIKGTRRFYPTETNVSTNLGAESYIDVGVIPPPSVQHSQRHYNRYQKTDQQDILLGRRQTWGNLDFGLEANYMKQDKYYNIMEFIWAPEQFDPLYMRSGTIWNHYLSKRYGVNLDGSYKLGERQIIEFRVDFFNEKHELDGNLRASQEPGGYNDSRKPVSYKRDTWHVQISDTIALNDKKDLRLTLITRWDKAKDSTNTENYFLSSKDNADSAGTYGIALKKEIGDAWTFRGTGGAYVRYPNFYELYGDGVYVVPAMAGSSYSLPERESGYQWDIGADWRGNLLNARVHLSATYFDRLTDNQIYPSYEPLYGTIQHVNAGIVKAQGVEFDGSFNRGRLDVDASATWQKTLLLKTTGGRTLLHEGDPLTLMPEWETYVRGAYRLLNSRLSLFGEYHYTANMLENWVYSINDRGVNRRAMHVVGAGLRYKTPWGFTLVSGLDDIFNKRPEQRYEYYSSTFGDTVSHPAVFPSPGRTWYVTLDYLYGRGSASDASGAGSTDSDATAGAAPVFADSSKSPDYGKSTNGGKFFYIAPKLIYTNQKAEMADKNIDVLPGNISEGPSFPYIPPEYSSLQVSLEGTGKRDSWIGGGLAIGADLYDRYNLPMRIEFEADLPKSATIYGTPLSFSAPDTPDEIPGIRSLSSANNNSEYRSHSAFINMYYDFHNGTRFTPYVGAGVGLSFVKTYGYAGVTVRSVTMSQSGVRASLGDTADWNDGVRERHFAWNAGAGMSYKLTDDIDIDVSYRHVNTGFDGRKGADYNQGLYRQAEGLYIAYLNVQAPKLDLRSQRQALMSLRFSF